MLRIILLSSLMAISLMSSSVVGQEAQTTTWKGTLDAGGTKLRLEIDITRNADELSGELCSLDQNNARLKLSEIKTEGDSLSFSVSQIGAKFEGKYEEDSAVAKGTFSQGAANLPLTLTKAGTKATEAKEIPKYKLKEAWVGKVDMGLMNPVMQFRIVTTESGETGAFFDSVTEGRTDFEATWSIEDDTLKFDVEKIKLRYRGTLNENRDTARRNLESGWTQSSADAEKAWRPNTTVRTFGRIGLSVRVGPFPYDAEEVKFDNKVDNLTLAGTLTIPRGPGKHPAVILISGSGPQGP